jgi:putative two-component system response regulator
VKIVNRSNAKILIADDEEMNVVLLEDLLQDEGYETVTARNGEEAVNIAINDLPDIILMDIMMPKMNGIEATNILKSNEKTKNIPVLMLTALSDSNSKKDAVKAGAVDFITKPINIEDLLTTIKLYLKRRDFTIYKKVYSTELEKTLEIKNKELEQAYIEVKSLSLETLELLAKTTEYRDDITGKHTKRVGKISKLIAEDISNNSDFVESIEYAAALHDIGKVGIPDNILLKPGKLLPEEFEKMKEHTIIGKKILENSKSKMIIMAAEIAYNHHEWWNGNGYPRGIKGDEIPLEARITAVADVFDALSSKRQYKPAFSYEKSFEIIKSEVGSHFQPEIFKIFEKRYDEIIDLKERMKD